MAKRKTYTVNTDSPNHKLNVRKEPSLDAEVLALLAYGEKVKIDPNAETIEGWRAIEGGGFVMSKYIK